MIEPIQDMPPGTLGFRATGKLTRADYEDVLLPPLREAVDRGEVRLVFQIGPDFEGIDPGALIEDLKASFQLVVGHTSAWKRMAVVSDLDWVRHAVNLLGWMAPGELRLFKLDELDEAKRWAAA